MTDSEELAYIAGHKMAYREMLGRCLRELDAADRDANAWAAERADVVAALRAVCDEHGDNDWDDDLHLGDVINKHLAPYLGER